MPRPNVIHDPARQDARTSPREPTVAVHHLTQLDLARRWNMSTRTLERHRWLGAIDPREVVDAARAL